MTLMHTCTTSMEGIATALSLVYILLIVNKCSCLPVNDRRRYGV